MIIFTPLEIMPRSGVSTRTEFSATLEFLTGFTFEKGG